MLHRQNPMYKTGNPKSIEYVNTRIAHTDIIRTDPTILTHANFTQHNRPKISCAAPHATDH